MTPGQLHNERTGGRHEVRFAQYSNLLKFNNPLQARDRGGFKYGNYDE